MSTTPFQTLEASVMQLLQEHVTLRKDYERLEREHQHIKNALQQIIERLHALQLKI